MSARVDVLESIGRATWILDGVKFASPEDFAKAVDAVAAYVRGEKPNPAAEPAVVPATLVRTFLNDEMPSVTCIKCGHAGRLKISVSEKLADLMMAEERAGFDRGWKACQAFFVEAPSDPTPSAADAERERVNPAAPPDAREPGGGARLRDDELILSVAKAIRAEEAGEPGEVDWRALHVADRDALIRHARVAMRAVRSHDIAAAPTAPRGVAALLERAAKLLGEAICASPDAGRDARWRAERTALLADYARTAVPVATPPEKKEP